LNLESGDQTVNAFNFEKEASRTHGVPFKFVVKPVSLQVNHINAPC
jgi:ubiquitin carboxyl-terminal hydrolase 7